MRSFSRQSCFFAFHLFPGWVYGPRRPHPSTKGEVHEVIERLWDEAARLASGAADKLTPALAPPECAVHYGVGGEWWSVRMPMALEPPEPSLLVVDLSQATPDVYLSEVFLAQMRPMLWAKIAATGEHAIMDWLEDGKRESIIRSMNEYGRVDRLRPLDTGVVLGHLGLYAQINHELMQARSKEMG